MKRNKGRVFSRKKTQGRSDGRQAPPGRTASRNMSSKKKKSPQNQNTIVFMLQVFSFFLCLSIIFLCVVLLMKANSERGRETRRTNPEESTSLSPSDINSDIPPELTDALQAEQEVLPSPTEGLMTSPVVESYFGPLPVAESPEPLRAFEAKALYIVNGTQMTRNTLLAQTTDINTFVLDLKESSGVEFDSNSSLVKDTGTLNDMYAIFGGLKSFIDSLHANDIKVIGRIVCFKETQFAQTYPDRAICDADGNVLKFPGDDGEAFLNPYDQRNWDYLIDLALEAVEAGVDEIQFDYVRFPVGKGHPDGKSDVAGTPYFGDPATLPTRVETINRFLQTARIRIQDEYGIPVTADIFGTVLSIKADGEALGQDWATVGLTGIHAVSPMIYPSHYAVPSILNGITIEKPDFSPYEVIYNALMDGHMAASAEGFAVVRPYLQAFSETYKGEGNFMHYTYEDINAQIRALQDAGYSEWILWNGRGEYPEGAYDGA